MEFVGEKDVHELGDEVDLERPEGPSVLEPEVTLQVQVLDVLDPGVTYGGHRHHAATCCLQSG